MTVALSNALENDVLAVAKVRGIDSLLRLICEVTGMGFAVVSRVTEEDWTACVVHDDIGFGIKPRDQLGIHTTLCKEARQTRSPLAIDFASSHPVYKDHQTPRLYGIESYLSVPIILADGEYFGNLCAVHSEPIVVSDARTVALFMTLAELISAQIAPESLRMGPA
jgi:GAF domain-containing protein